MTSVPSPAPPVEDEPFIEPTFRSARNQPDHQAFERLPPQDLDAERSVLGSMILSKTAITDVSNLLAADDFYRPAHQTIYRAILELAAKDPVDPLTLADALLKSGDLAKIGGASYLHTLVQSVPTSANAEYYAEIVRERAVLRRLVAAGTKIVQMGYEERASSTSSLRLLPRRSRP